MRVDLLYRCRTSLMRLAVVWVVVLTLPINGLSRVLLSVLGPLPCRAVRLAYQQIQRLLTEGCVRQAGKNQMLRAYYPACGHESARFKLEALVHQVHEGLKLIPSHDERWDVWLQAGVVAAFERWLDSLGEADLSRAAAISGYLSQARPETPERLRAWHLPTRGYSPQLC